jgi:hypothetical protein
MNFYGENVLYWVGVVKEIVDETFVKVRIFGVHPLEESEVDSHDLPLAQVIYPTIGGQVGGGMSAHDLQVDSWVIGFSFDKTHAQPFVLGSFQGTSYSMSTYAHESGAFVGQPGSSQSDDSSPGVSTGGTLNLTGTNNTERVYNYVWDKLTEEGYTGDKHIVISGMIGVLLLETPGIDPTVVGGYRGRAWGICQWLGSRRAELFRRYGRTRRLDEQLDFMWWELNNTEARAKARWLNSTNIPDATAGFASFERAEEWQNGRINRSHRNFRLRLEYAYQTYNSISYTGGVQNNAGGGRGNVDPTGLQRII